MIPVPAPTSKILNGLFVIGTQAPSKTPSVPIFIAQRSCCIENCLNENMMIYDCRFTIFNFGFFVNADLLDFNK
jgi:hypothetical protein